MSNLDIREAAKAKGVPLWSIAKHLGISEPTMTRKLRTELPEAEKKRMLDVIEVIANNRA